ncbi:hypothetical protein C8R43DRAFT_556494 [Mycena crocata]|nr:hypothetical protein C8R43DRAFT_556494 [Mycena crocata]
MSSTSTPSTSHLVSFLTRPLMKSYTPATVVALQLALLAALSESASTLTLFLSATCPPPAPLQRACLASGIRWADWIRLLSSGLDCTLFLTPTSVAVRLGTMPRRVVWSASASAAGQPTSTSFKPLRSVSVSATPTPFNGVTRGLRATLASALTRTRTRIGPAAALNPTRIPTLLSASCTFAPASPSSESEFSSASDDSDDSDSDYAPSDSGRSSTSSSSVYTSASEYSVSSAATSATSLSSVCTAAAMKPAVYTAPRPAAPKPTAAAPVTRYMYQGGVTQVMSGRVMLGVAAPSALPSARPAAVVRPAASSPRKAPATQRKPASSSAAQAGSWRRAAPVAVTVAAAA